MSQTPLQRPVATGVPSLDAILTGGYTESRVHLIEGQPGSGRTTLALQFLTSELNDLNLHSISHGVLRLEHLPALYGAERRRLRCIKMRGVKFRGGYHDFVIDRGGIKVFPRLVAADHHRHFDEDVAESGQAELDALLDGGLDRGTSTLLIGPAGSGKSSLATRFVLSALERGEPALIMNFDEVQRVLPKRTAGMGMDLRPFLDLTYLSDTVLLLRFFEAAGRIRRAISVIKKRTGSHEDTIREYRIDAQGVEVGPPLAEFQGVLTGVPTFRGSVASLLKERSDERA